MTQDERLTTSRNGGAPGEGGSPTIKSVTVADLGNNLTQVGAIYQVGDEAVVGLAEMPSARSLTGASLRKARELRGGTLGKTDHVLRFPQEVGGFVEEFVGDLALLVNASAARGSDTRYTDGWTTRPLLAGICATHPSKVTRIDTTVYTIAPWDIYLDHGDEVSAALTKTWKFGYNGDDRAVRVSKTIVDGEGKIGYPFLVQEYPEIAQGTTLLIDWGARTVCPAIFRDGHFVEGTQIELGIDRLLDDVGFPRPLTPSELFDLKNALRENKPYTIRHNHRDVRVDELARAQFPYGVHRCVQEISPVIQIGNADNVIVYGGGAYFTSAHFREQHDNIKLRVPPKPETVNLRSMLVQAQADLGVKVKTRARQVR